MASNLPFEQLTGVLQIYLAPVGEAVPDVDTAPAGNWALLGTTDGDQIFTQSGSLTYFSDNDHVGPVKAVRAEGGFMFSATLVDLTLEAWADVTRVQADLVSAAGPPAVRRLPMIRPADPDEYAVLLRHPTGSPYGVLPMQGVIPRAVFDGEPTPTFSKSGRASILFVAHALADDTQADDDDRWGWVEAQTA